MNKDTQSFFDNLKAAGSRAVLDASKKAQVKQSLISAIESNPVRSRNLFRRIQQSAPLSFISNLFSKPMLIPVLVIALMLFGGAGTTVAANQSLPGDILYPVKLNINEKVKGVLAVSDESKAEYNLELLDRRMDEGTTLAAQGKLNADTQAKLDLKISECKDRLDKLLGNLDEEQKLAVMTAISARLEAMIAVHEEALGQFQNDEDNNKFRENLKKRMEDTAKARSEFVGKVVADSESKPNNPDWFKVAADNKIDAAAKIIAQVEEFVNKKTGEDAWVKISDNSLASAKVQLKLANDKLSEARNQKDKGQYKEAFLSANESIRIAQQAKGIIRVGRNSKVDVYIKDRDTNYNKDDQGSNNDERNRNDSKEDNNNRSVETKTDAQIKLDSLNKLKLNR